MVHFATDPDGQIFIADDLVPRFVGKPGTAADLIAGGARRGAKAALPKDARAETDKDCALLPSPRPNPNDPDHLYYHAFMPIQTAACADALKSKLIIP